MKTKRNYASQALKLASELVSTRTSKSEGKRSFETNYVVMMEIVSNGTTLRKWNIAIESYQEYEYSAKNIFETLFDNDCHQINFVKTYTSDYVRVQIYDKSLSYLRSVYFRLYNKDLVDPMQWLVDRIFQQVLDQDLERELG